MKTTIFLLMLGILVTACAGKAQKQPACNRTVYIDSFAQRLPKDICLPEGYMLRAILSDTTDMNGDGRADFAAKLCKIDVRDGDTTLVVLYKQDQHGHFTEWTTFDNLFPIYLIDYDYDYYRDKEDTSYFMELRQRYIYPELSDVSFAKDTIILKFNTDAGGGHLLYFALNETQSDWTLVKQKEWFGRLARIEGIPNYGIVTPEDQYSIREFNMLNYIE
jgi:hypothetical protein